MTMHKQLEGAQGLYPHSVPEISFVDAPYRRYIPSLTETAARQGDSSARVCGDN